VVFIYLDFAIGGRHCDNFIIVVDSVFIYQSLRRIDIPQCWLEFTPHHDKLLNKFHFMALHVWLLKAAH